MLERNYSWNITGKVGENFNRSNFTGGFTSQIFNSNSDISSNSNARSTSVNFYSRNNYDNVTGKIGAV